MDIEIPAEYRSFIASRVACGAFSSEQDVITEALRQMRRREGCRAALREELRPALERLDRGEYDEVDDAGLEQIFDHIKRERRGDHGRIQPS
jgi:putative addiction module CopG family antidote